LLKVTAQGQVAAFATLAAQAPRQPPVGLRCLVARSQTAISAQQVQHGSEQLAGLPHVRCVLDTAPP